MKQKDDPLFADYITKLIPQPHTTSIKLTKPNKVKKYSHLFVIFSFFFSVSIGAFCFLEARQNIDVQSTLLATAGATFTVDKE